MATQRAFSCDGPDCEVLTARNDGEKGAPQNWTRITLRVPGGEPGDKIEGAFHDVQCAHDWLDDLLDTKTAPVDKTHTGPLAEQKN